MNATVNATTNATKIFLHVDPTVINIVNAVIYGILSVLLFAAPRRFMQITQFKSVPPDASNRVFYLARFLALVYFGGFVVPVFVSSDYELLAAQAAFLHGLNHLHTWVRMCPPGRSVYKESVRYDGEQDGVHFWGASLLFSFGLCLGSALAVRVQPHVQAPSSEYVQASVANVISLVFSSLFALGFVCAPNKIIELFWSKEHLVRGEDSMTHNEKWWLRCIGLALLALNVGMAIDQHVHHGLFRLQTVVILGTLVVFNVFQICTRYYEKMARPWLWTLTTLSSAAVMVVSILSYV